MKKAEAISILAASVRPREAKDRARYDEAVRMAIEALKCSETPKSSEQNAETAQADHIAESGRKVEQTGETAQNVQNEDLILRKAAIEALARMMPRSYTPDGSHPADEEIFRAQEVFADCIEAFEILPSAQPERKMGKWIYNSPVTMKCNQCGFVIKDWDWHRFKFCPNCDCDMRGEQK